MPSDFVRLRRAAAGAALLVTTLVSGCSLGGDTTLPPFTNPATVAYASSTGVVIANMTRVNEHVYSQDLVVGTGRTLAVGDSMTVFYKGALSTGFVFGNVARPSTPLTSVLDSTLIKGWNSGLPGMKVGGTRRLAIGPESAYRYSSITDQQTGSVIIPSNSVLVFEVELFSSVAKP
jgi:FKBP-type peptidyl-prolyl cis-trans isomerase FkpA